LPGDIDGMVHMSDLSWDLAGEEAIKNYQKGQNVEVKVLDIDSEKERISLGIKQLSQDPFEGVSVGFKKGDVVTCTVSAVQEAGIEVTLGDAANGFTGFIKRGDLARDRSEQRADRFAVGEKVDAKITSIEKGSRKVGLSIKAREVEEEKKAMEEYGSSDSGASLGDILGAAIKKAQKKED
jgi:small subunit ribosomal protein S1